MTDAWVPATQDVARWIARLTGNGNAGLTGDFDSSTTPTDTQVALIIDQASAEVRVAVGVTADPAFDPWIRTVVAMEAAAQVVLAYDPQATDLATTLHTWYETSLGRLLALARPGTSDGGGSQPITGYVGTPGTLVWSMPPAPLEPYGGLYARPWDIVDLPWLLRSAFPPSFWGV